MTPQQKNDLKLCVQAENIVTQFLNNDYGELEKAATFIGFESNAFCYHPAMKKWYFDENVPTEDQKGFKPAY